MIDVRPDTRPVTSGTATPLPRPRRWHLHWFTWAAGDWAQTSSRYACRCGVARQGL